MKTNELTGAALDWAVAQCEGVSVEYIDDSITRCLLVTPLGSGIYSPSTDWAQGGSIIERGGCICLETTMGVYWWASNFELELEVGGNTPLEAAMRCYVAGKLGREIDVPEELLK